MRAHRQESRAQRLSGWWGIIILFIRWSGRPRSALYPWPSFAPGDGCSQQPSGSWRAQSCTRMLCAPTSENPRAESPKHVQAHDCDSERHSHASCIHRIDTSVPNDTASRPSHSAAFSCRPPSLSPPPNLPTLGTKFMPSSPPSLPPSSPRRRSGPSPPGTSRSPRPASPAAPRPPRP